MENATDSLFTETPDINQTEEEVVTPQEAVEVVQPEETIVEEVNEEPKQPVRRFDVSETILNILTEGATEENLTKLAQEVAFETATLFFTKDPNMLKLKLPLKIGYLDLKHKYEEVYGCKVEEDDEAIEEDMEIPESSPFAGVFAKKFDPKLLDDVLDTVFVAPLLLENTEAVIHRLFEGCGNIVEIKKDTGNFAFVKFENPDSVDLALKKDGTRVDDMIISVELPKLSKHVSVYSLVISNIPYIEGDPKNSWTKEDAENFICEGIHNEIYRMQRESDYSRFVNCGNTLAPIISKWPYDLKFYPTKKEMIRTSQTKVNHKYAKIVFRHWSYAFFALKCLDGKKVNEVAVEIYPIAKFKKRSVHNIVIVREIPEEWTVHDIKTAFGDFGMIGMIQKLPQVGKNDFEVHFIDISAAKQILGVASKNGGYIDLGRGQSPNISIRVERVPKRMKYDGNYHISGYHHSSRPHYRRGYYGRRYQRGRGRYNNYNRGYNHHHHQGGGGGGYGSHQGGQGGQYGGGHHHSQDGGGYGGGGGGHHHSQHHHHSQQSSYGGGGHHRGGGGYGGGGHHSQGHQMHHQQDSYGGSGMSGGGGGIGSYGSHNRRNKSDDHHSSLYHRGGSSRSGNVGGGGYKNYYGSSQNRSSGGGGGMFGGGGGGSYGGGGYHGGSGTGDTGGDTTSTTGGTGSNEVKDYSSYYTDNQSSASYGATGGASTATATGTGTGTGGDDFNEKRYYTDSYGSSSGGGGGDYDGGSRFGGGGSYNRSYDTTTSTGGGGSYGYGSGDSRQTSYNLHQGVDSTSSKKTSEGGSEETGDGQSVYHEPDPQPFSTSSSTPVVTSTTTDNEAGSGSAYAQYGAPVSQSSTVVGGFVNHVDNLPSPERATKKSSSATDTTTSGFPLFGGDKSTMNTWGPVEKESTGEKGD